MANAPRFVRITDAEVEKVLTLFHTRHGVHLEPGEAFTYQGTISHGEVDLTVRLSDPEESDVLVLEGHMDLERNDVQNPNEGKDILLNFIDEVLTVYFEDNRELKLRDDWKEHGFEGHALLMRGSRRNLKLERMADALLADANG